jgi:hypothetical protein
MLAFTIFFFEKLRMTEIGPRGAERGHPFFRRRILAKKVNLKHNKIKRLIIKVKIKRTNK